MGVLRPIVQHKNIGIILFNQESGFILGMNEVCSRDFKIPLQVVF